MKGAVRRNSASSLANAPTTSPCNNGSSLEGTGGKMPPDLILRQWLINGSMRCRSEAQSQPPRDSPSQAARRGQAAVELRLVVDPRHEPGEQDEVGDGIQARPPGHEHRRLAIHHHAAVVLVG